jgi:hypothetical protein
VISNKFNELLKKYISNIRDLDIIFETTPIGSGGQYILDGFKTYNNRKQRYDDIPKEMKSLNDYLMNNRQAYIFCHPRIYNELKELLSNKKTFENILNEVNRRDSIV